MNKMDIWFKTVVVQKSMVRSGGTVLRLILNRVFNDEKCFANHSYRYPVDRTHSYEKLRPGGNKVLITTWRDPKDVAVSLIRVGRKKTFSSNSDLVAACDDIMGSFNGIRLAEKENPEGLFLKYENWHCNFDYLFDRLEDTYDGKISKEIRDSIEKDFSKEAIRKKQSVFSNFSEYDKDTHIHGDHVHNGFRQWDKVFNEKQIKILDNKLESYIEYWEKLE